MSAARSHPTDSTLALLREGYAFLLHRSERDHTDVFETRLLGLPVLCLHGEEAARVFYDPERFERRGAAPPRAQKTLFGQGGVQGLDGEAHRARKGMFMSLMTPDRLRDLARPTTAQWHAAAVKWEMQDRVVLLVGATTENPSFSVVAPLLSRSLVLGLHALDDEAVGVLLDRAVADPRGLDGAVTLHPEARAHLVHEPIVAPVVRGAGDVGGRARVREVLGALGEGAGDHDGGLDAEARQLVRDGHCRSPQLPVPVAYRE